MSKAPCEDCPWFAATSETIADLEAERDRLVEAINWACGCAGSDFGEHRPEGSGHYWWRSVLTEKAGLTYNRDLARYVMATHERPVRT